MRLAGWKCDVCGAEKKEKNHWWLLGVSLGGPMELRLWDEKTAQVANWQHLCGEKCVMAQVGKFMGGKKGQVSEFMGAQ